METTEIQTSNPTPATLIQLAVQQNLDLDKLERLMQLQERWEANNARKDFFQALADFQSVVPVIKKNKSADYGGAKAKYTYATLDAIISQIQDPLKSCGLTYRWEFTEAEKQIIVTCIITHKNGHKEVTKMSGDADTSGSKNAIQARGSTLTYLQRYTLIGALGLGTTQDDVDGEKTDDEVLKEISDNLDLLNDKDEIVAYFEQAGIKPYHDNPKVIALFTKRREALGISKKKQPVKN